MPRKCVELLIRPGHGRTLVTLAFVASIRDREVWRDEDVVTPALFGFKRLKPLALDNCYAVEFTAPEHGGDRYSGQRPRYCGGSSSPEPSWTTQRIARSKGYTPYWKDVAIVSAMRSVDRWAYSRREEIMNRMPEGGMPLTEGELRRSQSHCSFHNLFQEERLIYNPETNPNL
ncbi:hypothetical protein PG994_014103 [Apiospora phragmitis]|uniref:Uncharacterized protein n=1 Tax=Apiospora phragmitis TaxID=2905665 RepID=A0ABR1T3D5_9PEZI